MLEILKGVFEKAGVANTPEFIQWFASPEVQALKDFPVPFPEESARLVNQNLINFDTAKTNKEIRKAIKGEVLGEVDNDGILSFLNEIHTPEEKIKEIMSAGTTAQKTKAAAKYAFDQGGSSKATPSDRERKLAEQISEQNKMFESYKGQTETEKKNFEQEIKNVKINYALKNSLMSHSLRDDLDRDDINLLTENKLNRWLSENKATMVLTPSGGLEIMDAEEPGTPFYDKNAGKHVKFNDIFPKLLADNKMLKVADNNTQLSTTQAVNKGGATPQYLPYGDQLNDLIKAQLSQ